MKATIIQTAIILFSGAAIFVLAQPDPAYRWGFVIGILGQPFWVYASLKARPMQWGVMVLSVVYTFSYGLGIYNNFVGVR